MRCSIDRLLQAPEPVAFLAAEVHVLDDVEVVAQCEILVDDLDSRARPRPSGCWMCTGLPSNKISPLSGRVDAGDALDQRRLAGAVVADERHDLAVAHLEVDVGERLHRPERLRDAAELEDRRLAHGVGFPTTQAGGGARGRPHLSVLFGYLQNCANSPTHTSLFFRNLSLKSLV